MTRAAQSGNPAYSVSGVGVKDVTETANAVGSRFGHELP